MTEVQTPRTRRGARITCTCGETIAASTYEQLVAQAEIHVHRRHDALSRRDARRRLLAQAERTA